MNRREFLKASLTTGVVAAFGKVSFGTAEEEADRQYELTFQTIYIPGYRWEDGSGGWVHQHDGVNRLWTYSDNDGHVNLGWHECSNPRAFNHDKYLEASSLIHAELNKIHWRWPIVEASFLVPRWTMIEMGILPEEAFHGQA